MRKRRGKLYSSDKERRDEEDKRSVRKGSKYTNERDRVKGKKEKKKKRQFKW